MFKGSVHYGTKVKLITANKDKYTVRAMCSILEISTSGYYSYKEPEVAKVEHTELVTRIFNENYKAYGTRRIKKECKRLGVIISRRRIGRIMHSEALVSSYTVSKYKVEKTAVNNDKVENHVDRQFDNRDSLEVIVRDLTYVRVGSAWNYICTLMDLHNREIVGHSCGPYKDANLVYKAFASIKTNLSKIEYFHTDRGSEFKNKIIDEVLDTFNIKRSLSKKESPYDNAVAEVTFKSIKLKFVYPHVFKNIEELESQFGAFVWWFNNKRLHSSLGYISPIEFKNKTL